MMNYIDKHFPGRIALAIVFATLFMMLGYAVPNIYFRYFDTTQYYVVTQPIPVDKPYYKPCDTTVLLAQRTALIDMQATFIADLTLIRMDKVQQKIPVGQLHTAASIKHGTQVIAVPYPLPCKLGDGLYFWQATMKYSVNGFEKQYTYISETFHVTQTGVSQNGQNAIDSATQSAH